MRNTPEIRPTWTTGWTDVFNTGTWRSAVPVYERRSAPCQKTCPVGTDIPKWIGLARQGDLHRAWRIFVEANPFPATTGRICHHPCESECNRGAFDGSVTINALEQYVGDRALEQGWELIADPIAQNAPHVAVVGGGPAGLSCAYHLRRAGISVIVFEAHAEVGGMLQRGIPDYRLPQAIVKGEAERLLQLGITVRTNAAVATADVPLLKEEYDAVFLAVGAQRGKTLAQFPTDTTMSALPFLETINQNRGIFPGQDTVVIGGGSVAMDVARSAMRQGSRVTVIALEDRDALPAQPEEVRGALDEGMHLIAGAMVKTAQQTKSRIEFDCCKVTLEVPGLTGWQSPREISGTSFPMSADRVVLAIGQEPDSASVPAELVGSSGVVEVDSNQATRWDSVFAGGDVASTRRFVSVAISEGKASAEAILARVKRETTGSMVPLLGPPVAYSEINLAYFPTSPRVLRAEVPAETRILNFEEERRGLPEEMFFAQAERCFSCGLCTRCDNCYAYCPDLAVVRVPEEISGYRINPQYCKGCGLCVEECPCGAVFMKEE